MTLPILGVVLGSHTIFCCVITDKERIPILPGQSYEMSDTVVWNECWSVKQLDGKRTNGINVNGETQEKVSITSPQLFLGKEFMEVQTMSDQYTGVQVFPKGDEEVVFEIESHYYSLMSIIKVQFKYMLNLVNKLNKSISNCIIAVPISIWKSKKAMNTLTMACRELDLTISIVMDSVPLTYLYLKEHSVEIDKESKYYLVVDWKYRCLLFILVHVEKKKKYVITPVTHWEIPFIGYGEVLVDLCSLIGKKMGSERHFKCYMNGKPYFVRELAKEIICLFIESEKKREYKDYLFSYKENEKSISVTITHRELCLLLAHHQRRMMYGLNQVLDAWGMTADDIDCVITNGRLCGLPSSIREINRLFSLKSICNYSLKYHGILDGLVVFSRTNEGEEGGDSRRVNSNVCLKQSSDKDDSIMITVDTTEPLPYSRNMEIRVDRPLSIRLFVNDKEEKCTTIEEAQYGSYYITLTITYEYQLHLFLLQMTTNSLLCDYTLSMRNHSPLC